MAAPYRTEEITKKADLANWLCVQHKASSYLELATASTGFQFSLVSRTLFSTVHRALYRIPADYDDGMEVTFPSTAPNSHECKAALLAAGRRYDVIFLDPWHSYEDSIHDLKLGLELLADGGVMVVHDCCPTRREITVPDYIEGEWMGVTYLAFLDLMRDRPELDYCVADMDYGCAVIWRRKAGKAPMPHRALLTSCNYHDWDTYFANRRELLNLLPTSETLNHLRKRPLTRLIPASIRFRQASLETCTRLGQSTKETAGRLKQKVVSAHESFHARSRRYRKVLRITKRVTRQILRLPPA
ncbi:MAG TPA: class I SAM-dependent methyltransferase [Roseimicrobium sp.]|nr:class I SAM-dependent methyltransferase [Roseimicrobium sp.]